MSRLLVAVLLLAARLLGTGVPHAQASGVSADLLVICHAGDAPAPPTAPGKPTSHEHDCPLCVAAHHAGHAILPASSALVADPAVVARAAQPAWLPASTGPPRPARRAAPPTGPPARLV